jgi:hypothetical protein
VRVGAVVECLSGGGAHSRGDARSAVLVQRAFPRNLPVHSFALALLPTTTSLSHYSLHCEYGALCFSVLWSDVVLVGAARSKAHRVPLLHVWELPHSYSQLLLLRNMKPIVASKGKTTQLRLVHLTLLSIAALTSTQQVRAAATSARCDDIPRQSAQWLDHHSLRT